MITDINSEDRLVQQTFADHLHKKLGWDSVYAWNEETFGPAGMPGVFQRVGTSVPQRHLRVAFQ